jgi:opacity protein-like surface antigen
MGRFLAAAVITCVSLTVATSATGQEPQAAVPPLPRERIASFVVDARIPLPRFKQDASVAAALGVEATDLPTTGIGIVAGAHVYPFRGRSIALGLGGEIVRTHRSKTRKAETDATEDGPTVKTRWSNISPQVSLNFGSRDGWSYVTVGVGRSKLTTELQDDPQQEPSTSVRTLNYGGGARWFAKDHLAVNLDLRFYSINAQEASAGRVGTPKMRLLVFSAGISIR